MSDKKLTQLSSGTAEGTDIVYAVKDPAGTPADSKIAISSIKDYITGEANTWNEDQTFDKTLNKVTITAPDTGATLTIEDGKTLTVSNTLTLEGTDSTTMTFPSDSGTVATLNASNLFTTAQTISPDTDVQGLTVRGGPSGTTDILAIQDSANNPLASFDKDGKLTLGDGSSLTGTLKFANSTNNNVVAFEAGETSGDVTFTLPVADGSSGDALVTDGSGALSWDAVVKGAAGNDKEVQLNSSGDFSGSSSLTFDSNTLQIGVADTATGGLALAHATSEHLTTLQAGDASEAVTYTLPLADGNEYQVLQTDGSGGLSWKTTEQINGIGFASLPGSPTAGYIAYITDSTDDAAAWGDAITEGGGTYKYLVWYNGTAWTVIGK